MERKLNKSRFALLFSALMMAALVAAVLPFGVSAAASTAAASCRTYYVIRSKDTAPFIAHTFGVRWKDIAKANDLVVGEKLETGLRLCIPPKSETTNNNDNTSTNTNSAGQTVPNNESNAVITINTSNGAIFINTESRIVAMSFCEPRSCRLQLSS